MNLLLWLKENWGFLLGYCLADHFICHKTWHEIYDELPFIVFGILIYEVLSWYYHQRKANHGTRKDPS